jgi:cytochrome c-type biogenesis protein CcmH
VLLARSYQMLGRAADAAKTFARAIELVPGSPQLYADYADMQVAAAGGQWTEGAVKAVAQALVLDPAHPKAMWLAGTEAYARKDFKAALTYWEKVLPLTEPGSEVQRKIQGNIDEARGLLGKAPAATVAAAPAPVASAVPPARPTAGGTDLSGTIALEPKIAAQLKGTETVFVFARAAQGPKMPLAIRRIRVQDLPYRFTLDDSAAMAPGMVISAFDQVVVGARVSRSGDAAPKPGDFEGYSAPVKPGTSGIVVSIGAEVR